MMRDTSLKHDEEHKLRGEEKEKKDNRLVEKKGLDQQQPSFLDIALATHFHAQRLATKASNREPISKKGEPLEEKELHHNLNML